MLKYLDKLKCSLETWLLHHKQDLKRKVGPSNVDALLLLLDFCLLTNMALYNFHQVKIAVGLSRMLQNKLLQW